MNKVLVAALLVSGLTLNAEEGQSWFQSFKALPGQGLTFVRNGFNTASDVVTNNKAYQASTKFVADVYTNYATPVIAPTVEFLTKTPTRQCGLIATSGIVAAAAVKLVSDKLAAKGILKSPKAKLIFNGVSYSLVAALTAYGIYTYFPAAAETVVEELGKQA